MVLRGISDFDGEKNLTQLVKQLSFLFCYNKIFPRFFNVLLFIVKSRENNLWHNIPQASRTKRSVGLGVLINLFLRYQLSQSARAAVTKCDRLGLIQQKYILHSSGDWEVDEQGASRLSSWWEHSSWSVDSLLLAVSSHGVSLVCASGEREISLQFLIRILISSWGPTLMT